jgi:hypothetical protein
MQILVQSLFVVKESCLVWRAANLEGSPAALGAGGETPRSTGSGTCSSPETSRPTLLDLALVLPLRQELIRIQNTKLRTGLNSENTPPPTRGLYIGKYPYPPRGISHCLGGGGGQGRDDQKDRLKFCEQLWNMVINNRRKSKDERNKREQMFM